MTDWAIAMAPCWACGRLFGFNPHRVPSMRDAAGERQPVCADCMALANRRREAAGLAPLEILPGAYDPLPGELL